jgi:hypothetical protein
MLETKQESWVWVTKFVNDLPRHNTGWTPFTAFVVPILQTCVDVGLDKYFRVGQSMTHIIFSTAERHGLERYDPPPPRITLLHERPTDEWFIAWSRTNLIVKPEAAERRTKINAQNAIPVLKAYLIDLWRETHPEDALPQPLVNVE